jgi:hypothetical protein
MATLPRERLIADDARPVPRVVRRRRSRGLDMALRLVVLGVGALVFLFPFY